MLKTAIILFVISFNAYPNFSKHESRFYQAQAIFIKENWKKIIENESDRLVNTGPIVNDVDRLKKEYVKLKKCNDKTNCFMDCLKKMREVLNNLELQSLNILSSLGGINLSRIEKSPTRYTLLIKSLADINQTITELKILINGKLSDEKFSLTDKENDLSDLITLSENLHFLIKTVPQTMFKEKAKNLLILGENEFINQLSISISKMEIKNFHNLDKIFNTINRDLQKGENLVSMSSKSTLRQIHQRWNAILKIVKRK